MEIKITFHGNKDCRDSAAEKLIKLAANATMEKVYPGMNACVDITLLNAEQIAKINGEYRNKPDVTDVLSFPMIEMVCGKYEGNIQTEIDPDTGKIPLGDMFICVSRAREQALDFGHSFERECAYLTTHSILHLLGYDHEGCEEDRVLMRKIEEQIMKNIGILRN